MKCFPTSPQEVASDHTRLASLSDRDHILGGHFSDHSGPVHLLSMSRFLPADHQDCILASEIITTSASISASPASIALIEQSRGAEVRASWSVCGWECSLASHTNMSPHHRKVLSFFMSVACLAALALISTSLIDVFGGQQQRAVNGDNLLVEDLSISGSANDIATNFVTPPLQSIQLDEIFQNQLAANYFNGTWATSSKLAFYDLEYNLLMFDVGSGKVTKHIAFQQVLINNLKGLELSKDLRYLLTPTDTIELFRHSKLERLRVYDIANKRFLSLFPHSDAYYFQFGVFGPRDSQLVFVYNNDIYYKHTATSEAIRLTTTGLNGVVFNGHADWLYEEEILDTSRALWFSPNATYLAYLQINDTAVEMASWNRYGDYYNLTNNQYPVMEMLRYPKPGTNNPQITFYVVNLSQNVDDIRRVIIYPPAAMAEIDHYVTKAVWYDEDRLLVAWTARNQSTSTLVIYNRYRQWRGEELYSLKLDTGWVDGFESGLVVASINNSILVRIPKLVGDDFYFHVAAIDITSKAITFLTDGHFDVIKVIAYSHVLDEVFYSSTMLGHAEVKHILQVPLIGAHESVCLTCYLGNSCRYNEVAFNAPATFYVLECKGYEIPRVEIRAAKTNELVRILDNNHKLYTFLKNKHIPRYEKLYVKLAGQYDAIVELILPPSFNEEQQYPLVIELYGAPGTQTVIDKYEMNHWSSYLTTSVAYIYARIDVRGTCHQGVRYMHQLYKSVGRLEVDDFIHVVSFLRNNLTYIDPERIAMWGWSYGGYMGLMSLVRERDQRLFTCAIAVAPVSNWMYYDSAYTERFLGLAEPSNLQPYHDSNLLESVDMLKNKQFMLIFGTSDDNVHIQHSLLLIRRLNELNIDYDVQIYPDDNHYLFQSTPHMYRKMSNYLHKCFSSR